VSGNTVINNRYSGPENTDASGILVEGGAAFGTPNSAAVVSKNIVTNNDVGVWFFNASNCDTVCLASTTATKNQAKLNTISNDGVFNTTGISANPACGYQAGVADLGKNDGIVNNKISGLGYTQISGDCGGSPAAFLRFIDVTTKAHAVPSNK
jgi:hypothetical protein